MRIHVHPRITAKRPSVTAGDLRAAFLGTIRKAPRFETEPTQWVGVGLDHRGRLLEYIATEYRQDEWHIFHSMPATKKTLRDIGLGR